MITSPWTDGQQTGRRLPKTDTSRAPQPEERTSSGEQHAKRRPSRGGCRPEHRPQEAQSPPASPEQTCRHCSSPACKPAAAPMEQCDGTVRPHAQVPAQHMRRHGIFVLSCCGSTPGLEGDGIQLRRIRRFPGLVLIHHIDCRRCKSLLSRGQSVHGRCMCPCSCGCLTYRYPSASPPGGRTLPATRAALA